MRTRRSAPNQTRSVTWDKNDCDMISKLLGTLLLAGMGLLMAGTVAAQGSERRVPVSVSSVLVTDLFDEIPLTATVTPVREAYLSARVEGFVASIEVEEGREVGTDDVILELDPTLAQIEIERVRAELEEARVRHREAIRQRDEIAGLVEKKHIADTEMARAESEVALFAAGVRRLQAELDREQVLLVRHTVKAPFPGVVVEKPVELGAWVTTSTQLVRLIEIDRVKVVVPVPQTFYSAVSGNTRVEVTFDALPGFTYVGRVTTRIPIGADASRTFPVHVQIDNADRLIAPGMSARVTMRVNHSTGAMLLPKDAVIRNADGREHVWLIGEDDGVAVVSQVVIESGRSLRGWVEVRTGKLSRGAHVVVRGNEGLSEGQSVEVMEVMSPPS